MNEIIIKAPSAGLTGYARKARVAIEEKNLPYEWVIARPSDPNSGVSKFNPLGKIPRYPDTGMGSCPLGKMYEFRRSFSGVSTISLRANRSRRILPF